MEIKLHKFYRTKNGGPVYIYKKKTDDCFIGALGDRDYFEWHINGIAIGRSNKYDIVGELEWLDDPS